MPINNENELIVSVRLIPILKLSISRQQRINFIHRRGTASLIAIEEEMKLLAASLNAQCECYSARLRIID